MATLVSEVQNAANVSTLIRQALENVRASIISRMGTSRRNATGASVKSLHIESGASEGTLYGARGFIAMETGRMAGKIPRGFTLMLKEWIRAKGISLYGTGGRKPSRASVAYLMAQTIRKSGTGLHRRQGYDDIYRTAIATEVEALREKLFISASSTIQHINQIFVRE